MGTAQAGFESTIEVSDDDTTYDAIGGANSVSGNRSRAELDATDFTDTGMSRILGLSDVDFSIDGNYDGTDPGQAAIEAAFNSGSDIWVKALWDGTNGYKAKCVVVSHEISSTPDGKVEVSTSLMGSDGSGWTAVP